MNSDSSECVSEPSGIGTMADLVQMWMALFQSRPSMRPPLTETTFLSCYALGRSASIILEQFYGVVEQPATSQGGGAKPGPGNLSWT